MCLAQGHYTVPPVRLELGTLLHQDKYSTTELLMKVSFSAAVKAVIIKLCIVILICILIEHTL